jgi:ABC-type arginine/histidine transport system permease subunit
VYHFDGSQRHTFSHSGRQIDSLGDNRKDLVSPALTWTTVFNLHSSMTIIVVLALLLTANALYQYPTRNDQSRGFTFLITLVYITPLISQFIALYIGAQVFTLVLAATGAYQLFLVRLLKNSPCGSKVISM